MSWRYMALGCAASLFVVLIYTPRADAQRSYARDFADPIAQSIWFDGFGLTTPSTTRHVGRYMAVGYEAVVDTSRTWGIDVRRDSFGGTLGENDDVVLLFGVGFNFGWWPQRNAPNGFYVAPHGSVGFGTFITKDEFTGGNALVDAGALEVGTNAGYAWTLWNRVNVRAGVGATLLYIPDFNETIVAGGLSGNLRIGYVFGVR